ncbi:MAG: hypothetical protein V4525_04150 [Pseudomonadota bacterium]
MNDNKNKPNLKNPPSSSMTYGLLGKLMNPKEPVIDEKQLDELIKKNRELYNFISQREKNLEEAEGAFKHAQIEREKKLQAERKQLDEVFSARETQLQKRSLEIEQRAAEQEALILQLRLELNKEKDELTNKFIGQLKDLAQEKAQYQKEIQERLATSSATFVDEAIDSLKKNERWFYWTSFCWSLLGGAVILISLIILWNSFHTGLEEIIKNKDIGWMLFGFLAAKSMVLIGLVFALTKYTMMFSKSYMHESLRNIERQHAIKFGKFYLGTYGTGANWESVKAVFEHWNISRKCDFLENSQEKLHGTPNSTLTAPETSISSFGKIAESAIDAGKTITKKLTEKDN